MFARTVIIIGLLSLPGARSAAADDAAQVAALLEKAKQITSYRCTLQRETRNAVIANKKVEWADAKSEATVARRLPDYALVETRGWLNPARAGAPHEKEAARKRVLNPKVMWDYLDRGNQATRVNLARLREQRGEAAAQALVTSSLGDSDPLYWFLILDPKSARLVDTKTAGRHTLYVIEGVPSGPLPMGEVTDSIAAQRKIQVTVLEDGFPRNVLVQRYAQVDVLKLNASGVDLNPELPAELFHFTPPPGCQITDQTDAAVNMFGAAPKAENAPTKP